MQYEIQFARLATTEKLPDRFLNAQLQANSDLTKAGMGEVFMLVEILTPWLPTAQIGQSIIKTFAESYYNSGSTSDLVNFEESLKNINTNLAKIIQEGETEWIGKLNSVLGVVVENKLHLAQAGKAEAYVFRDGKTNHLTEGLASTIEPHPLKTFSNITSGELKTHDKILIANPELYNYISLDNLQEIISMSTPYEAVMQIAKILKKQKVNKVNALVINLLTSDELAKQPVENDEDTIYLDKPLESAWIHVVKFYQQFMSPVFKIFAKGTQKAASKGVGFTKNYVKTLQEKRKESQPPKKKDLFEKEFIDGESDNNLLKDEEIQYSPELEVHYYNQKQKKKENKLGGILASITGGIAKVFSFLTEKFKNKQFRPYFYVAFAIILICVLILAVSCKKKSTNSNLNLSQAQSTLHTAEAAQKDAKSAVLANDKEKAKTLFAQAISEAQKIVDFPIVGGDAKKIVDESYTEMDKLTSTTRFSELNPLLSANEDIQGIFIISTNGYLVSKNNIYSGLLSGGKTQKLATLPSNTGDYTFGTTEDSNIYLYTSSQKVYEFKTQTSKIDLAKISGNWETANSGSIYASSFYLLDGIVGQIYKHSSSSDSFAAGETYINTKSVDLKNGLSLAIDGALYVLKRDGSVIKLQKGKQQEFSLQDIPTPYNKIEGATKISTDADTPSIYILDNGSKENPQKRILEFDKTGHFLHQYALPTNLSTITDFYISSKSKKAWFSTGKNLYEISI